jgi:membrane protein implicated in regulation of membrane protease activity
MMKTFYILTWILLALTAGVSFSMGYFDAFTMVVLSFVAVSLVYALALWSTITTTPDIMPKVFHRNDELIKRRNQ